MEALNLKYEAIKKALATLKEGIDEIESYQVEMPKVHTLMRDGVIQRFEYCIDSFWKFFKIYLEMVEKISVESPSPRTILRLSSDSKLISDNEYKILLNCVSERNLTSHTYDEALARKIHNHIPLYYETMKGIMDRLNIKE
jgi:nucleotidyltransferase substrate binding protein (TIGR01987 family)